MSGDTVFLLLEGPHDVALCRRLCKDLLGFDDDDAPIRDFPPGLSGYMRQRLGTRPVDDRSLKQLGAADPPSFAAALRRVQLRLLLVRTSGKDQVEAVRTFVEEIRDIAPQDDGYGGQGAAWRVIFMVDADDSLGDRLTELQNRYAASLGCAQWEWGKWLQAGHLQVAAVPWCLPDATTGTLEALGQRWLRVELATARMAASEFVEAHAERGRKLTGSSTARQAKREKASLNTLNQLYNPGANLTALYGDGELVQPRPEDCETLRTLLNALGD